MTDMGTFNTAIDIENVTARGTLLRVVALVDTGAEATWVPRDLLEQLGVAVERRETYQMADGRLRERDIGYAIVHAGGRSTVDEVVFAEPADLVILGARSLEGMNLRVEPRTKQLVSAGPIPAAAIA